MKFLIGSLIALFTLPAFAQPNVEAVKKCLQTKYGELTNHNSSVAAVVSADKTELLTFGNATLDQIFEIGSVTKTFTGTLLAKAVLEKGIKLSDSILPFYQKPDEVITYEQLTTHTAGFTNSIKSYYTNTNRDFPYEGLTSTVFKGLYSKINLVSKPGEKFLYSNTGTAILALNLEEIFNQDYQTLVKTNIFNVLGMKDSYFTVPDSQMYRFPKANANGDIWPYWDLSNTPFEGVGGIRSTVSDMALYLKANLIQSDSSLSSAMELAHQPLFKKEYGQIGMNWLVSDKGLVWHNGSTIGFNSVLVFSKRLGLGVVAMTDTSWYKINPEGKEEFDFTFENIAFNCLLNP
jgi:CubicO group peptidase (beta-lactamase class C family)